MSRERRRERRRKIQLSHAMVGEERRVGEGSRVNGGSRKRAAKRPRTMNSLKKKRLPISVEKSVAASVGLSSSGDAAGAGESPSRAAGS